VNKRAYMEQWHENERAKREAESKKALADYLISQAEREVKDELYAERMSRERMLYPNGYKRKPVARTSDSFMVLAVGVVFGLAIFTVGVIFF